MARRESQEVNAGSMADIAFLLLIFFLVTTTMDSDKGLGTILPPYEEEPPIDNKAKNERNVFEILVNANNQLMVEKQEMDIAHLTEATKAFILNPNNLPELSDKETRKITLLGQRQVSKGVISLQTANDTKYQVYLMVQNELIRAFNEMRNDFAISTFGKEYIDLDKDEKEAVRQTIPKLISEAEPVKIASR
ncbi:biopolymer transporter ExbD [Carboxylicivirga mesophila]|uniref:Biopolymer transporter ExbD n=1 Tax=Carboxylicivirga mesophila TaxID=1166478 RepID=A0ABS5KBF2_9BACT|nr:biopolymer transporter ExbD [Carboxylicivirga mesophila]MBS2212202.1 biopolymer transporter ExbD [Carboxylicivirga mesophila]